MNRPRAEDPRSSLSPRTREELEELYAESDRLAEQTVALIFDQVPEYARMEDPSWRSDVMELSAVTMRACAASLRELTLPNADALSQMVTRVRRRAHQGVPLQAVLKAFRIGLRVTWDRTLDKAWKDVALREDLLFRIGPLFLDLTDLLAETLTVTYAEEAQQRRRWRDRLRHELCSILYTEPENVDGFRERASRLGLDPLAPHVALALSVPELGGIGDEEQRELDAIVNRVAAILGVDPDGLVATLRANRLLVWFQAPQLSSSSLAERALFDKAGEIVSARCGVTAVGVGLPETAAVGWRRSADQALAAIDVGGLLAPSGTVFRYSDVAIEHIAMESPALSQLLQSQLEQLAARDMLLETLRAFIEHGPHRKAVAAALDIHPNTLSYRIECIEDVLGERLDDLKQLPRLHLALRLRELSLSRARRGQSR